MKIPPLKINFKKDEREWILERIDKILKTGQLSQGVNVSEFEDKFAEFVNAKYAIAVNSGTSSIEIVMRCLEIEEKDVLVSTNTFLATASAVKFAGGNVVLMDCDRTTMSVNLEEIKKRVTKNTAGVIVVHIGGIITPEIVEIKKWCDDNGLWLFEDAAHAHGSQLDGKHAGTFGIAGSYSLFATKVITSGEGGVIVTDSEELANKAKLLRNHGKPEAWVTYNVDLGSNWRMSEILGVIALSQTNQLPDILKIRSKIADKYTELMNQYLPELEVIRPKGVCSWYKYIVLLPDHVDRDTIKQKLRQEEIGLQGEVYATPLHQQPVAVKLGVDPNETYETADDICSQHISLPMYLSITDEEMEQVVLALKSALAGTMKSNE